MNTCDNCANKNSEYCEIKNRDEYGFCGNFNKADALAVADKVLKGKYDSKGGR